MKLVAEQRFVTTLLDEVESTIDGKIVGLENGVGAKRNGHHHHHHTVMSAHEIDQAAEERFKYVSNKLKKEKVDDFNIHEKVEPIKNKTRKVHEMSQKDFEAGTQRLWSFIGFLTASTLTVSSMLVARQYTIENDELHKLNQIIANPNAKVAVGDKQADKILNHIKKYQNHPDDSQDSSDEGEQVQAPKSLKQPDYAPPSMEYSLCDFGEYENQNVVVSAPSSVPLMTYSMPPKSNPLYPAMPDFDPKDPLRTRK